MGTIGTPAKDLADLPQGSRVVLNSSTKVIPTRSTSPQPVGAPVTFSPGSPGLPPVPAHPLLSNGPGAPPAAVLKMMTDVVGRTGSGTRRTAPLPGRAFNSTFDAPPADVQQHLAQLVNLRSVLGNALTDIDTALTAGTKLLTLLQAIPGIATLAAKEGIDLVLVNTFLESLKALLDQVKPPLPTPEPSPAPAPAPEPTPAPVPPSPAE